MSWGALSTVDYDLEVTKAEAAGKSFLANVLRNLKASAEADGVQEPSGQPETPTDPGDGSEGVTHAGLAVQAADTGRVLLIQRSLDQQDAPDVQGTWEFPGGGMEGEEGPEEAARREFCEEVGCPVPEGVITGGWASANGVYQGFVLTVDIEREAFDQMNPDVAHTPNPDDPERRKPDVAAWFSLPQIQALGPNLRPEVHDTDWSQFSAGGGDHDYSEPEPEEEPMPKNDTKTAAQVLADSVRGVQLTPEERATIDANLDIATRLPSVEPDVAAMTPEQMLAHLEALVAAGTSTAVPWHGVLTVEGRKSGDGRGFRLGALRSRPMPLPLSWQKTSDEGHKKAVTVATIDRQVRVPTADGEAEIRAHGRMLQTAEADEVIGLIGEFGRFGVSIDADDTTMEADPDADAVWFSDSRSAGSCIVGIPAFYEATVQIGEQPSDWYDGGQDLAVSGENPTESLVASAATMVTEADMLVPFADLAPGLTEDGPGWLTNPVDTDRLRNYWSKPGEEGYDKIGWGTHPGDFDTCRVLLAPYVKPEFLSGYCANRHHDALGVWPGQEKLAAETMELTEAPADVLSMVASAAYSTKAPAEWFSMAETDGPCALTITDDGQVYGHVALWNVCHLNVGAYGKCFLAPKSPTNYSHFRLGAVHTDQGKVAVGSLSIGGGHAGGRLGLRPAIEHYDSTSTAFAHVAASDGKYGIWVCGWVPPGTPEALVIAARASKLSGDWRQTSSGLDMVAALAVNVPGYEVPRVAASIQDGEVFSLVAAGVVDLPPAVETAAVDVDALAMAVALRLEEFRLNGLALAELVTKFETQEEVKV